MHAQVEWLLSIVHSLKNVILDLHLGKTVHPGLPLSTDSEIDAKIKGSASSAFLNLQAPVNPC